MSGRRFIANLLFEGELAARRTTPSRSARETAAGYGTLLRALLREGDRLWLPLPVDPARLPEVPGLPSPILESGPLADLPVGAETLAWGESREVARLRRRSGEPPPPSETSASLPWTDLLWRLPHPAPEVVARVHHRAFALATARELGCALPGAAMLASLPELERHLALGAVAGPPAEGRWVLKAPLSASGRDRYIERHPQGRPGLAEPAQRRRLERLFAERGPLLFEPWLERESDYGACALLAPDGLLELGFHRLLVDLRGQFAGIEVDLDRNEAGLAPEEAERFRRTVEAVGAALRREGYLGPFGLDAWRYRSGAALAFHPLGEINARLTFGFVARALAERLADSDRASGARRFRLEVGRLSEGALPLLLGTAGAAGGAPLAGISILPAEDGSERAATMPRP